MCAKGRASLLLNAAEGRQIVPLTLHGPNFIALIGKGLLRICFYAHVNEKRLSVTI